VIIVADTSPLISLALIGQLDLLDELFTGLFIPEAVWKELDNLADVFLLPQVRRFKLNVRTLTKPLAISSNLGKGEREAIQLFDEINADEMLIDDGDGRQFAESRGILCTGTIGVLGEAKDLGLIPSLRPLFAELLAKKRYFALPLLNAFLSVNNELPL
jgi:predicted nucleic acid-binding protein